MLHCGCLLWHIRRYKRNAFYEPLSVFMATLTLWAYSSYTARALPRSRSPQDAEYGRGRSESLSAEHSPSIFLDSQGVVGSSTTMSHPEPPDLPTSPDDLPNPAFIRLDRPNDDEMVQLFVRSGRPAVMRAYISGVGDICGPKGPQKILREGRRILTGLSLCWGRTREYIDLLCGIENVFDTRGEME